MTVTQGNTSDLEQRLLDNSRSFVRGLDGGGCRVIVRTETKVLVQMTSGSKKDAMEWLPSNQVPLARGEQPKQSEIAKGDLCGTATPIERKAQAMLRVILGDRA